MNLSKDQIFYIENYIQSFDIKYYEVFIEIVDHIILSVEDILDKETISFEDAVIKAKNEGFGMFSFSEIEEERVVLINKKQRKAYSSHLKTYFTLPYFILTILIFLCSFLVLNSFEKPHKVALIILVPMVLYCLVDWLKKEFKFRKKNNLKVLKMQNYAYLLNLVMIWLHLLNAFGIFGLENLNGSFGYKIFASCILTLSFLSLLFFIKFSKKVTQEIQQQIFV